jgi:hypothetical protein
VPTLAVVQKFLHLDAARRRDQQANFSGNIVGRQHKHPSKSLKESWINCNRATSELPKSLLAKTKSEVSVGSDRLKDVQFGGDLGWFAGCVKADERGRQGEGEQEWPGHS